MSDAVLCSGEHRVNEATNGPVVAAKELEAAVYAMEELEEAAKVTLLTMGMRPCLLSQDQIADIVGHFGAEWDG
jgi:ribulose-5-phosphate 4-epimerase/fuculose-1-phosphate aldolase